MYRGYSWGCTGGTVGGVQGGTVGGVQGHSWGCTGGTVGGVQMLSEFRGGGQSLISPSDIFAITFYW